MLSLVSQFLCCYLPEVNFEKSAIVCGEIFCMSVLILKTCGSPSGLQLCCLWGRNSPASSLNSISTDSHEFLGEI